MSGKLICGVALIVQNPEGEILVLQEFQSKPHFGKQSGMFSIPMETAEPEELDISALIRLVREELPGFNLPLCELPKHIGSYQIVPQTLVNLYFIKTNNGNLPVCEDSQNKEVGNHQWILPEEALELWLRLGAKEMISDFCALQ
jgi:hypothetical protein